MRQLRSFLDSIHIRNTKTRYYDHKFMASLHKAEITPLEEILGVSSDVSQFDDKTDSELEKRALQLFKERKMMHNV